MSGSVAHMDETPLRIQTSGTGKSDTGYLWALCRDERHWNPDTHPAVYYEYAPTRAGGHLIVRGPITVSGTRAEMLRDDTQVSLTPVHRSRSG